MDFFRKLFKSKTSKNQSRSVGGARRSNRSRSRSRSRARYVGGAELSPADFTQGSGSGSAEYMLKTVGNVSDQMNNVGNTNSIQPLSGSLSGGRRKGGRKTRGGFMGEVLRQGIVPAALVGMSLYKGKGLHQGKSYRSKITTRKSQ